MPIKDPVERRKQNAEGARRYRAKKRAEDLEGWKAHQNKMSIRRRQKHPEKQMFISAQRRARNRELEFTIQESDIQIPKVCPILGIPLFSAVGTGCYTDNSPTIDRIDPSKGYTPDNIQVVSFRGNLLKSNGTLEEFKKVVDFLKSQ